MLQGITNKIQNIFSLPKKNNISENQTTEKSNNNSTDLSNISNTAKIFDSVNKLMDLGDSNRFSEADIDKLNPSEKAEFLKMLGESLKNGSMSYEVVEVNGKPEKHFIVNEIGDERLYGSKLSRKYYQQKNKDNSGI